jgi:hypothetical protein
MGLYAFGLTALLAAYGVVRAAQRFGTPARAILMTATAAMMILGAGSDFVASDNPFVKRTFYTPYFEKSEVVALAWARDLAPTSLATDFAAARHLDAQGKDAHLLALRQGQLQDPEATVIVRTGELERRPLQLQTSATAGLEAVDVGVRNRVYIDGSHLAWQQLDARPRIADAQAVQAYGRA